VKFSVKDLVEEGFPTNIRKRRYCLREEGKENVLQERNVNVGGRPTLSEENVEKVRGFLMDNSTESRFIGKERVFFYYNFEFS
jgi:hypothetical protein